MRARGFTLIEVMVSVAIFSIVMTVALGALLAMSESDRRAEVLKTLANNLNFVLDDMSRTIRTGYNYHCGTSGTDFSTPEPQDCPITPQQFFAFKAADGSLIAYCYASGGIQREIVTSGSLTPNCSSSEYYPLTSADVNVTNVEFIVTGSCPKAGAANCVGDSIQPKVTIILSGSFQASATSPITPFNIQTSVAQRVYDQ